MSQIASTNNLLIEDYLRKVRKGMRGVSKARKHDICAEIGAGLEAKLANVSDVSAAIGEMANPVALGRAMRAVHGISWWIRPLFWIVAFPLGLLSFPLISAFIPSFPVTLFLVFGTLWTIWAASLGGRISGMITGAMVALPRIIMLIITQVSLDSLQSTANYEGWSIDAGTSFGVLITSLMLPLIGFLSGKRLKPPQ